MHLLFTSWRDINNPQSGGAEILTHEIAKRMVKRGHQVTIISGGFKKSDVNGQKSQLKASPPLVEIIDGVSIVRPANFFPTDFKSYLKWPIFLYEISRACKKLEKDIDFVIDQVHGLPSFTPLYLNKPVIIFPLEYAGEIWNYEVPFPGNLIGKLLERKYLKLFRNHPFITISSSVKKALEKFGIKDIDLITPGINPPPKNLPPKTKQPTFLSLSRITPMKRIEDTIIAFLKVCQLFPKSQLHIVGRGKPKYEQQLVKQAKSLNLQANIFFHSFVSEKEKFKLLASSWALISTSLKEGFGLNVIEAASVSTPTLAYKVPGIIDTVKHNQTGLLTPKNTPQNLAKIMEEFVTKKNLRKKLSQQAKQNSKNYSWEKTTDQFLSAINKNLNPAP